MRTYSRSSNDLVESLSSLACFVLDEARGNVRTECGGALVRTYSRISKYLVGKLSSFCLIVLCEARGSVRTELGGAHLKAC